MPWMPELFSAPVLEELLRKRRRDDLLSVPFFYGLTAGEPDALLASFAGEPELYDPVRGRIKGENAFREFTARMNEWLVSRNVSVEDVRRVILEERGFEEVVLHVEGEDGPVDLPFASVTDHPSGARIGEIRLYYSNWPLTGRHAIRPPLLQPDLGLPVPDVVAEHRQALAAGDLDAVLATFEPDGYLRDPSGESYPRQGPDGLRAFYEPLFSNGGGVQLEVCTVVDDGQACAMELNVTRWGPTEQPPQAGVAVFVRGDSGRLAAVHLYDDVDRV